MSLLKCVIPAALILLSACGKDGKGGGTRNPVGPKVPVPGALEVRLVTPNSDDRAIMLTLSGPSVPGSTTVMGPEFRLFSREVSGTMRMAVFGPISSGVLLRFTVPDVEEASRYQATFVQAASATNAVRAGGSGYELRVVRP